MSNFYFVGSSERFELPIPGAQSRKIAVTAFDKTKLINQCVCQLPPTAPYKQDLFFKMFKVLYRTELPSKLMPGLDLNQRLPR